ncbi:hypothetical protein Tco_0868108 [Tanacetum coccineum]
MSSSNSRRNGTFGFQNLSSELERQGLEMDCFLHFQPGTLDRGCGYFKWMDSPSDVNTSKFFSSIVNHLSYSPGTSQSSFLRIKTLEARIRILEGQLEMKRHPENHTLESAAILDEIYNGMGNLNME